VKKFKTYCFDIDNTICKTKGNNYSKAKPKKKIIKIINRLHESGHKIIFFTSRYMGRNKDNVKKAHNQGYKFTLNQLNKWEIKFHKLIMGKPSFDLLIDDKTLGYKKNWHEKFNGI
jgi:hypothetical protein